MANEAQRTGEEAQIQNELKDVDQMVGQQIEDNPQGNRQQRRRANFIDLYGDEDGDPNTTEGTYRRKQG
jgi:hypothetical protein